MEDKQAICTSLCECLKLTRQFHNLVSLEYREAPMHPGGEATAEFVDAKFKNGLSKTACVSMDSGTAMIFDIMRQIG